MAAIRARKQSQLAKRKEIRAQLLARAMLEKVKAKPWRKLGKLPARPLAVYMTEHFKAAQEPGEKIGVVMKRVVAQFKALTAEQRLPYEEKAAANLKVREAASAKIQGLKINVMPTASSSRPTTRRWLTASPVRRSLRGPWSTVRRWP